MMLTEIEKETLRIFKRTGRYFGTLIEESGFYEELNKSNTIDYPKENPIPNLTGKGLLELRPGLLGLLLYGDVKRINKALGEEETNTCVWKSPSHNYLTDCTRFFKSRESEELPDICPFCTRLVTQAKEEAKDTVFFDTLP